MNPIVAARLLRKRLRRLGAGPELSRRRLARFAAGARPIPLTGAPATLAVVIASYGHGPYVETMLRSVASQTWPPDEIVIVDDHSPDGSGETFRRLIEERPVEDRGRWHLLANDRTMGQSASLNRGIEVSSSELLMILNADDYLMHDAVSTVIGLFAAHPELALIGATAVAFDTDEDLAAAGTSIADRTGGAEPALGIRQPAAVASYRTPLDLNMTHSGSTFRREAWKAVGGYTVDPKARVSRYDDRDFQLRVNALYPVGVASDVPFSFWRRGTSIRRNRRDVGEA